MTKLTGRVVKRGDVNWDAARKGFAASAAYDENEPYGVVFCESVEDVANAVLWALENNKSIRPRCGRHHYAAASSLVKDGIIVDVSPIRSVSVSAEGCTATVGAGLTMVDLYAALDKFGVTIPLATAKTVGISGLVLGGGFGMTTRKWGLTCDSLMAVELVLADGSIVNASAGDHSDLFWACCGGGGGNFGIATSFTFSVHPVGNVVLFTIYYDWDNFTDVVDRFQHWIDDLHDGITAYLTLRTIGILQLQGQFTADDKRLKDIHELLGPMMDANLGPIDSIVKTMPHSDASKVVLGIDLLMPQWLTSIDSVDQIFKSTSAFVYDYLPPNAISTLKRNLESVPLLSTPPSEPSMVVLLAGGGQAARRRRTETAATHRQARFAIQYDAYWTDPNDGVASIAWIETFRNQMSPYTVGAYVNYVDSLIHEPLKQYFGANLDRLIEVKRKYDPNGIFNSPQGIPLDH